MWVACRCEEQASSSSRRFVAASVQPTRQSQKKNGELGSTSLASPKFRLTLASKRSSLEKRPGIARRDCLPFGIRVTQAATNLEFKLTPEKVQAIVEGVSQAVFQWRRRAATLALCLIAVWVAYHVVFGANGTMVYSHKLSEHRTLDKEIIQLKEENARLAHHVNALKNDANTIEKEAREQLRYARPGEVIYTIPQSRSTTSTITAEKH